MATNFFDPIAKMHSSLPLPGVFAGMPRAKRLQVWLQVQGLSLAKLAKRMGVHKSAPGKWLISCREPLPAKRRAQLLAMQLPDNLLP